MSVDYETFRAMEWGDRVTTFNAISPQERAALVQTHITRWLDANREELSGAQIEILEENIAFIRAELYEQSRPTELLRAAQELETRTATLLSREQMRQALTMHW